MSDIRTKCPLECVCKDETKLGCDDEHCIRHKAYEKGKADRDKELTEHCVFISNRPIEDIVLEARADREEEIIDLIYFFEKTWNKESHKRVPHKAITELVEFIMQNDTSESVNKWLKEQKNETLCR